MAAAAITIGSAIVPVVLPFIVKLMDKIHGSGTGPTKLTDGTSLGEVIMAALQKFLPGVGLPMGSELKDKIQQTVDDLNKAGLLKGHDTVVDAPALVTQAFLLDMGSYLNNAAGQCINAAKMAAK